MNDDQNRASQTVDYSDSFDNEATVMADANQTCAICSGKGWHHGWDAITGHPVMMRCPCVDRNRAAMCMIENRRVEDQNDGE